jgi:DNA-binding PadR family transcriptional regulator
MLPRYAILALLCDRELHGYAIKAAFDERVGPFWTLNFGQIYQGLKQLKGRGLIIARFDSGNGHIGRWVYSITRKGRTALATWLKRAPRQPEPLRDEMFVRLLALNQATMSGDLRLQFVRQARLYRERIDQLTASEKPDEDMLRTLVRNAERFRAEAHLRWLESCETVLATAHESPGPSMNELDSAQAI